MNPSRFVLLLASILVLLAATAAPVKGQTPLVLKTYDVSHDFSLTANPNGVWSYGWKSNHTENFALLPFATTVNADNGVPIQVRQLASGQHPLLTFNATTNTAISNSGQEVHPPGSLLFTPGFDGWIQNFGVIRFTVPSQGDGTYTLECAVRSYLDGDRSGDTDFHVVVNGVETFAEFLAPRSATEYIDFFGLNAGDTIDFVVGRGADGRLNGSGLKIQATLTTLTACTPHAARATAQVVNGFVVGATIADGGCGYTNAPVVLIQGGGGTGATATAVVSGGLVTAITITSAGCCYTNTPRIVIGSPPFVPKLAISFSKVKVTQNVVMGRRYVLESSNDLAVWLPTGPPFTAVSEIIENEFDVNVTGRFFRLREML